MSGIYKNVIISIKDRFDIFYLPQDMSKILGKTKQLICSGCCVDLNANNNFEPLLKHFETQVKHL